MVHPHGPPTGPKFMTHPTERNINLQLPKAKYISNSFGCKFGDEICNKKNPVRDKKINLQINVIFIQ